MRETIIYTFHLPGKEFMCYNHYRTHIYTISPATVSEAHPHISLTLTCIGFIFTKDSELANESSTRDRGALAGTSSTSHSTFMTNILHSCLNTSTLSLYLVNPYKGCQTVHHLQRKMTPKYQQYSLCVQFY